MYLNDILTIEGNVEVSTIEFVEEALSSIRNDERPVLKIKCLNNAIRLLFDDSNQFKSDLSVETVFTLDFIKHLHSVIGHDIIPNAGNFRINYAKPYGENWEYLFPTKIESKLSKLLKDTIEVWKNIEESDIISYVKLASGFLHCFLQIHPFSNGNGRVGRLLISVLLHKIAVIPISLNWFSSKSREIYLQCLRH